jgi:hypothetical protein
LSLGASTAAEPKPRPTVLDENPATRALSPLEQKFQDMLSGKLLVGSYTVGGGDDQAPSDVAHDERRERQGPADSRAGVVAPSLHAERYRLLKVAPLKDGYWLFQAQIQYGEHNVTLPLTLRVIWAGETPVITVDDLPVPGLGTYSARVMFHEDRYAGTWRGADHGGHLFGRIVSQEQSNRTDAVPGPD